MWEMTLARLAVASLAAFAAFWALYVVLLPLLGRLRPARGAAPALPARTDLPAVAVIVPAHDMAAVIGQCVRSLHASRYPTGRLQVFVVADHCNDATLANAEAAGAIVLARTVGPPGKTYAIAWALEQLGQRGIRPDLYVVTDATAHVDAGFLGALAGRWQRGEDVVVAHSLVDLAHQQWFVQCLGLTLVHRNMQNLARERLDLSSLVEGRGMAYSRGYIERFGWGLALPTSAEAGAHPTEDWRHGVRLVEHGYRVAFADDAHVYTPLRETLSAATRQGMRWERGRMANAASHGVSVLAQAMRERNPRKLLAALDAIQLPVAVLGALCAVVAILTALVGAPGWQAVLGYAPMALLGVYGLFVIAQGQREGIRAATIAWAPVYVVWRCASFLLGLLAPGRR